MAAKGAKQMQMTQGLLRKRYEPMLIAASALSLLAFVNESDKTRDALLSFHVFQMVVELLQIDVAPKTALHSFMPTLIKAFGADGLLYAVCKHGLTLSVTTGEFMIATPTHASWHDFYAEQHITPQDEDLNDALAYLVLLHFHADSLERALAQASADVPTSNRFPEFAFGTCNALHRRRVGASLPLFQGTINALRAARSDVTLEHDNLPLVRGLASSGAVLPTLSKDAKSMRRRQKLLTYTSLFMRHDLARIILVILLSFTQSPFMDLRAVATAGTIISRLHKWTQKSNSWLGLQNLLITFLILSEQGFDAHWFQKLESNLKEASIFDTNSSAFQATVRSRAELLRNVQPVITSRGTIETLQSSGQYQKQMTTWTALAHSIASGHEHGPRAKMLINVEQERYFALFFNNGHCVWVDDLPPTEMQAMDGLFRRALSFYAEYNREAPWIPKHGMNAKRLAMARVNYKARKYLQTLGDKHAKAPAAVPGDGHAEPAPGHVKAAHHGAAPEHGKDAHHGTASEHAKDAHHGTASEHAKDAHHGAASEHGKDAHHGAAPEHAVFKGSP